jgi:hypothetical protein
MVVDGFPPGEAVRPKSKLSPTKWGLRVSRDLVRLKSLPEAPGIRLDRENGENQEIEFMF